MQKRDEKSVRITFFLILVIVFFALVGYRLFDLAYLQFEYYDGIADRRKLESERINRGDIYIQSTDGLVLVATTKKFPLIYVSPRDIEEKLQVASYLSTALDLDRNFLDRVLSKKDDPFEVLIKKADQELVDKVKEANIKGVGIDFEEDRYYPEGNVLSHVLGFVGFAKKSDIRVGQYGVEAFYEDVLTTEEEISTKIILTIDRDIQVFAERILTDVMGKWDSISGSIIVQDPNSGAILAMASSPSFNPNNYSSFPIKIFLNSVVQEVFEPGSSFKPITMAMAINENKVNPATTYFDPGELNISGYTIRNYDERSHGVQTMSQVLEKSLNTGAVYAMDQIGYDSFLNYSVGFRFGQKTEIDLTGELSGNLNNLKTVPKIRLNYATAAFGQGIAVTSIQMITAYSALANGGKLYKPYIVDTIVDENGNEKKTKPKVVSAPISKETSETISKMLVSVVDNGFDRARIDGYDIAGKTGTAQIADPRGGYSEDFIHNFLGYAPASDPKFVIMIKIDRPRGVNFASTSLVPVFREMTKFLLNHFNIPPTR